MVRFCCICKVEQGSEPDVSLHNIPKNEDLKQKWFAEIGREVNKYSAVCSKHFHGEDFIYKIVSGSVRRFLLPTAVPVINSYCDSSVLQNRSTFEGEKVCEESHEGHIEITEPMHDNDTRAKNSSLKSENKKGSIIYHQLNDISVPESSNTLDTETVQDPNDLDVTEEMHENNITSKSSLKRKSTDDESRRPKKKISNKRYLGDLKREDFTCDISYNVFNTQTNYYRKKIKILNQKVNRLTKKVNDFQSMLEHLKEKGLITEDGCIALEFSTCPTLAELIKNILGFNCEELEEATYALVVMLVALNGHFKTPIAYYFIKSLTAEVRANILNQILSGLHENGVSSIRAITFDGAATNIAMVKQLGANIHDITDFTYFEHPISNEHIVVIPDPCHMLKLTRNTMAEYNLIDKDGAIIQWKYLEKLVECQEKEKLHPGTTIRRRHVQFQREKMKVKLAAQTFSTSTANALLFMKEYYSMEFDGVDGTSRFCQTINDIFDVLNSRRKFGKNKNQECITYDLKPRQEDRDMPAVVLSLSLCGGSGDVAQVSS